MYTSEHHPILEEIALLERQRDDITERIRRLRATLPVRPAETVGPSSGLTQSQSRPIAVMVAANPTAIPVRAEPPQISDHAVLRYLERRFNFDFEGIRQQLLSPAVRMAVSMGARSVKVDNGRLIIKGNRVVTFAPKQGQLFKVRRGRDNILPEIDMDD